jgi:hypothetical protein
MTQTKMILDALLQLGSYAVTVLCWWIAAHYGAQILLSWWSAPKEARRPTENVRDIRKAS